MDIIPYHGWARNVRLRSGEAELVATLDVGPRIVRFGFQGGPNLFAHISEEDGGLGETEWKIRGGHRLWAAPEKRPVTYEPDNDSVAAEPLPNSGVRLIPPIGKLSGLQKIIEITPSDKDSGFTLVHRLVNTTPHPIEAAPWALSVMAPGGMAIVPLPPKIPHTECLTHNQEWSLWSYTDLTDPRLTLGSRFVQLRHDPARGPIKIGMAHREGWVAYRLGDTLVVKRFEHIASASYPDGNVNFEMFANESFLEIESLGPLTVLPPGGTVEHRESWTLMPCHQHFVTEEDLAEIALI